MLAGPSVLLLEIFVGIFVGLLVGANVGDTDGICTSSPLDDMKMITTIAATATMITDNAARSIEFVANICMILSYHYFFFLIAVFLPSHR